MAFNPDRLPAHAEPEQAAQILGGHHSHSHHQQAAPVAASRIAASANHIPYAAAQQKPQQSGGLPLNQPVPNYQAAGVNMTTHRHRHSANSPYAGAPQSQAPNGYAPAPGMKPGPGPSAQWQQQQQQQQQQQRLISRRPVGAGGQQQVYPAPSPTQSSMPPLGSIPERMFREANRSGTGYLSERELGSALQNSDSTRFDPATVRMLFKMYSQIDSQGQRIMSLPGFVEMYNYLNHWRTLYVEFDADRSGKITVDEFSIALSRFGFSLSEKLVRSMFTMFEAKAVQRSVAAGLPRESRPGLGFDLFMQAVVTLKRITDAFKQYDPDRDGYGMLSFEDFVTEVFALLD